MVDDEEHIRNLLALGMRDGGFSVSTAASGAEALQEIKREKPGLIILDLMMPEMSGEEVCRVIKQDPNLSKILVIILSAKDDLQTKLNCLKIGAEEYLVKPIEIEELVARVQRFFLLTGQVQQEREKIASSAPTILLQDFSSSETPHDKTQPTLHASDAPKIGLAPAVASKPIDPFQNLKAKYGGYRVETVAGAGGMGLVYKAYDEVLDRYVAVKVLSKAWSEPEFLAQFRREARLIASINHPRIAPVYTFGEQDGESYFALQWCSGGSLSELIKKNGKIELLQAIDFVLQCARGLEAAFQKGIVHRDMKPSNVMFDESQYIKIVDFGVAFKQTVTEKAAGSQPIIGSPSYMAPEQGKGETTDHRTDIYSLGITFYQMLYGRLPFTATSPFEWIRKHAEAPFPPYDDSGGKIPLKTYEIISRMTQKAPDARYQNYPDLIKDLEQLRSELYSQRRLKIPVAAKTGTGPSLRNNNFFELLTMMVRHERTGLLKASWGKLQKSFLIMRNEIVSFDSPQSDENCWTELVKRNLMKTDSVPPAGEDLETSLNRLLFLQACSLEDFKAIYREMMIRSLIQTFQWPSFEGEFYQAQIENEPFSRISISGILMAAARAVISLETVMVNVPRNQPLIRTSQFESLITELNLPKSENFLAARIEGETVTVENLQWLTGLSEEQISRAIYAWERLGALKYGTPVERKQRPKTAESRPKISVPGVEKPVVDPEPASFPRKTPQKVKATSKVESPKVDHASATKFFEKAKVNYEAGRFWEAERNLVQAISSNPLEGKYHHLIALSLAHHPHSIKAAEESFRRAIQLDPRNVTFRLDFAIFLKNLGRSEDALEQCDEIHRIVPYLHEAFELRKEISSKN